MNKIICILLLLILASFSASAACEVYTYASGTNGTDYYVVNTHGVNTTMMTADQLFGAYTYFTPRLNFTKNITENFTGYSNQTVVYMKWTSLTPVCNDTLLVYNMNDSTIIDKTNYTFVWINQTKGTWAIRWESDNFTGNATKYTCNRTFVKNVDDLIVSPELVYTDATTSLWFLSQAGGGSYGTSKTFILNGGLLGQYVNNTNWAVGWTYTNRTCTSSLEASAYNGINNTKGLLYVAFGLLAVLIIAIIAFALVQLVGGGNVDLMSTTIIAISSGIVLVVAFVIIYMVSKALGA